MNKTLICFTFFFLLNTMTSGEIPSECPIEKSFIQSGLINIQAMDSTIRVDLMYSSNANIFGEELYGCLEKCYLQPEVAKKLSRAQKELIKLFPLYSLLVLDGGRPRRVQIKMWNFVKETPLRSYVANPAKGSMHNYGAAVDVSVIEENGNEIDMGEPNPRTCIVNRSSEEIQEYLDSIHLTPKQIKNRSLLKEIMVKAGFIPLKHEWWHFTAYSSEEIRKNSGLLDNNALSGGIVLKPSALTQYYPILMIIWPLTMRARIP